MFGIIETGGKQYKVAVGGKIKVEKLDAEEGKSVTFDKVLLVAASDADVKIGKPYIMGAKVMGEVLEQGKREKLIVFKYKPKKRYRKKKGHRQPFTEVKITDIKV